jgi:chaperonin GroES
MNSKNLNLRPLSDRVVLEPHKNEGYTAGGLILPEMAKEKPQKGTVLAVGPGRINNHSRHIQMDVKTGDLVLYVMYAGTEIKINGKKLLILKESDILAIVEKDRH